jgi:murein DD-endopeptidase MepM/ murein hydrolase activator NlpD
MIQSSRMRNLHPMLRGLLRPVTLQIIPSDSTRTFRLRLPAAAFAAFAAVWMAAVAACVWLGGRHASYEAMRRLNAHLASRAERYARDVAKAEALARRLEPLEEDLRRRLARPREAAERGGGEGGPFASAVPEEIPARVSRLERVSEDLFRGYRALSSLAAATPSGWPVRGWISSEYGERISPYTGEVGSLHQGVDIASKLGSPIVATADGVVLHAAWTPGGYGKMVELAHGHGYSTRYGHCSRLRVAPGQRVSRGDVIAYVGATGNATGPHCHYEVRLYGVPVNPHPFMR